MTLSDFDLTTAGSIYAVSNSPLFLFRKLKADAAAQAISRSLTRDQIVTEIERALTQKPEHLNQAVEPYVLLAALQMKPECKVALEAVATLPAPYHDWFHYLAEISLQTLSSTSTRWFQVPAQSSQVLRTGSSAANNALSKIIIRP
jgi:hypothetical protein